MNGFALICRFITGLLLVFSAGINLFNQYDCPNQFNMKLLISGNWFRSSNGR
jgi:hypothetical protein